MQTGEEGGTKEFMMAVPLPLGVQRQEEEIGLLQCLQHLLALRRTGPGGDGLAESCIHARYDRCLKQKVLERRRQRRENVLLHIIQQITVGTRKVFHNSRIIWSLAQGERGQLQPGDPTLRPPGESGYLLL